MAESPMRRDDPNVVIPPAVLAAAKAAEELHKQIYAPEEPENKEGTEEAAPEQPADPQIEVTAEKPIVPQVSPARDWENDYKAMKGRYDRAQDQMRGMADRIGELERVIAGLRSAPAPVPEQVASKLVTSEEEAQWGEDLLTVVGKKAKEELTPEVAQLTKKIAELEGKLQGVGGYVVQTAREQMFASLDTQIPDWRQINTNPDFLDWLKLPDAYSGAIRHNLLKDAFDQNNAARVATFFKGFLAEEAATRPAEVADQAPEPGATKVPLESFAAPGRAKTAAATQSPPEKPLITRAQITRFYADVAAGKFQGREADKLKLENQIFEAQRDGRIR